MVPTVKCGVKGFFALVFAISHTGVVLSGDSPVLACLAGDFQGDGKTDLACYSGTGGEWRLVTLTPSGWQTLPGGGGPGPAILVGNQCLIGKYQGGAKTDLACYTGSGANWHVATLTPSGWQDLPTPGLTPGPKSPPQPKPPQPPPPPSSQGGTTVTFFNGSQYNPLYIYRADAKQGQVINCNTMATYVGTLSKNRNWTTTVSRVSRRTFGSSG